jgi:hypothetical protein
MATISTSTDVVGARFDPTRAPPIKEADEAAPLPEPAFVADSAPAAEDGIPF